ncbi:basic leucine zipper 34-like [Medicago truncatula]|uniref:basic leucine zipper 34-like n=1 Tax=Medicago truncatula TaxID=3880 RepID=UPI000D2F36D8|nr:basic leucine zipper 34-like [Medicago truncatula]
MTATEMLQTKEEPGSKKSNMVRPFSNGSSSAFRPWQPSWMSIGLGKQEASRSGVKATPQANTTNNMSGGSASANVGVGDQATQNLDPKRLKRIEANRVSSHKSRLKKLDYIADLEEMEKNLQAKLSFLRPQVEAYENQQRLLNLERHQLRLQIAVREKERILQEVEIENKRAEVNRLRELEKKLVAEAQNKRSNWRRSIKDNAN